MFLVYVRTVGLYLVLVGAIRLMGKRQIGQMAASEFVVTMMAANLATIPIQDGEMPVAYGIIPIVTVVVMEMLLTKLSLSSLFLRKLLCGQPVILIDNGKILQENLRRTRVTLDELIAQLRQKDVMDVGKVQYAILENSGNLSVFLFSKEMPASATAAGVKVPQRYLPITIISDGVLLSKNLPLAGKDRKWLDGVLSQHGADISSTWLLTVDKTGTVRFCGKEKRH